MLAVSSAFRPAAVQASAAGKGSKQSSKSCAPGAAALIIRSTKKSVLLGAVASVPTSIPAVALAFDKQQAESIAKSIEDDKQAIFSLFNKAAEATNAAKDALSPVMNEYGRPIVDELNKDVSKAAAELNKVAAPVVKRELDVVTRELSKDLDSTLKAAQGVIKSSGIDVEPLVGASKQVGSVAKEAVNTAEPAVFKAFNDAVNFVQHLDGAVITAASAVGIVAVATAPLWVPRAIKAVRGYAGGISAIKAYDEVCRGEAFLVDLRARKAQEKGVPSLPRDNGRLILLEPETVSDGALRSRLRDVESLETQSTAVVIASLKKITKTSKVILMGPKSVPVAVALSARGFSRVFVMDGGFDKKRGWIDSGLSTEAGPSPPKEIEVIEAKLLPF